MFIRKKDVKSLGQVLELKLLPRKNLLDIFFLRGQNEPPEVKACLMDAPVSYTHLAGSLIHS